MSQTEAAACYRHSAGPGGVDEDNAKLIHVSIRGLKEIIIGFFSCTDSQSPKSLVLQ